MRIGFKTSQQFVDWPTLLATWELGDELEVFDSAWIFDHFVALRDAGGPVHEGWTLASALAARTRRLQLGHIVLGNTYRHPALLARMAATLDHVAEGRFVLGLGAGWHQQEHEMYGWTFPPIGERISMVRSAVKVLQGLWTQPTGVSLDAPPYRLRDAVCDPPPYTSGGPPIWLGLQGPRGLRIVADLADGWNQNGDISEFAAKRDTVLRRCEQIGRDPREIEISAQVFGREGPASMLRNGVEYARMGVDHLILALPASAGPDGLRRLAREVAEPLSEQAG